MSRPRRLAPRYPAQLGARVVTGAGQELNYPVRDVSRGGAFLNTETPLEIFSEVAVHIALPNGQVACLPARVVHVMSSTKAQALGVPAGMGLQFEPNNGAHQEAIGALIEAARSQDRRARVPRRTAAGDTAELDDPMLAYVLAAVDGKSEPESVAEALSLDLDLAERLLRMLADQALVEFVAPSGAHAEPKAQPAPTTTGTAASSVASSEAKRQAKRQADPTAAGAAATPGAASPKAPAREALPMELQAELATRLAALAGQNHYETLGVPRAADLGAIRAAFFSLSKRFHPDAYFGRIDGESQRRLERLFSRLSEAYGVLGRKRSRKEYDDYLARDRKLGEAPPSAQPEALPTTSSASGTRATAVDPSTTAAAQTDRTAGPKARDTGDARTLQRNARDAASATPAVRPATPGKKAERAHGAAAKPVAARADELRQRKRAAAQNLRRTLSGTMRASRTAKPEPGLPERCLAEAESALQAGRNDDAMRSLTLIAAMDVDGPIKERADRLRATLMRKLAFEFEKKALYEERHQKWGAAAKSWRRVCEGRPEDPHAFRQAARAYMEARDDLRMAAKLAQRAVQLAPHDAAGHRILGHVYLEAGMNANARASLERAVQLNRADTQAGRLLKDLKRAI